MHAVADGVGTIDHAGMSTDGLVTVLCESGRKHVMASFNEATLTPASQREVVVPGLK